jgi:hypothetical protein
MWKVEDSITQIKQNSQSWLFVQGHPFQDPTNDLLNNFVLYGFRCANLSLDSSIPEGLNCDPRTGYKYKEPYAMNLQSIQVLGPRIIILLTAKEDGELAVLRNSYYPESLQELDSLHINLKREPLFPEVNKFYSATTIPIGTMNLDQGLGHPSIERNYYMAVAGEMDKRESMPDGPVILFNAWVGTE